MTRRLTPEEKARRAARRKLFRGPRALRLRTPEETTEYLAFVQKQGEEYFARSRRLAAAKARFAERWETEKHDRKIYGVSETGVMSSSFTTEVEKRAAYEATHKAPPARPPRKPWWRFW